MADLLEIDDLRVSFETEAGRVHAVNGVSYRLRRGEVLGVVGESGSGKSVHALAIMGLVAPPAGRIDAGAIRLDGRDLLALDEKAMRGIRGRQVAMIFQDPASSLNPVYTVGFQLGESLRLHLGLSARAAADRAAGLLSLVGIPDARQRLSSYPHEMSGGMRQRVMIAMAIACEPELVIADEPTTALDVTIQAQIVELVRRLRAEMGLTVIWISHDLGVIAGLARTVNVMYAGHVVERGPVGAIYKAPRHPYTIGLLGSVPGAAGRSGRRLQSIPGRPPDLARLAAGCPFAPRCAHAEALCRAEMPEVEEAGEGHTVRCWRWREIADGRAA